jgi:putative ABC transport system permease protein
MMADLRYALRMLAKSLAFNLLGRDKPGRVIGASISADVHDVLQLIVRQGMSLTVLGVVIGLAGAFGLTRLMASLLFGVGPTDPATFLWSAVLLASVSFFACHIPARRAALLDPIKALTSP